MEGSTALRVLGVPTGGGRFVAVASASVTVGASLVYLLRRRSRLMSSTSSSTAEKEQVLVLRKQHFCDAVSVSYSNTNPLMIVGGSGSKLYDSDGREFLDSRNNVSHLGHQHPAVVSAVQRQVATLNTNTRYLHPNATLLAQKLANLLPDPLEVVFLVNSGSEANDLALRLARAATGSDNTICVDGAYHGHTLACLEVSPYKYEKSEEFDLQPQIEDLPPGYDNPITPSKKIWKVPSPCTYRGLHRGEDAAESYAEYVEEACRVYTQERGEELGAFIVEGGMSVAGVILPPASYLKKAVDVIRDAGGLYIADEIQTGFGRFGSCYWAFQHGWDVADPSMHVVPDIVTVGKPFGNGMPLAAVVTTREIAQAFTDCGVELFNTFGGNPVCSAAGLAVLEAIETESLQKNAKDVGQYLMGEFKRLQKNNLDIIGDIRGSGFFVGIELVRDRRTLEPATEETSFLCTTMKEKYSVLTSIDGPNENVLVIKPPMPFSKEDVDQLIKAFELAVTVDLADISDVSSLSKTPT